MTALFLFPFLTGCVEDVGKDKVQAEVAEAKTVEPEATDGKVLKVDPTSSSIKALGAKVTATHPILFKDFTGTLTVTGEDVTGISFDVMMKTLESDDPRLTKHLKNEDFFDVEKFPKATFQSTSVKAGGEGGTHTVVGNLMVHGQTKSVTFPATIKSGEGKVKASTEFTIDRKDFGVIYAGRADDLIQDNVVLTIELAAM